MGGLEQPQASALTRFKPYPYGNSRGQLNSMGQEMLAFSDCFPICPMLYEVLYLEREMPLLTLFYRWGNQVSRYVRNLPRVTWLVKKLPPRQCDPEPML